MPDPRPAPRLRPCSIRRTGRAWQPRWRPSVRPWPTVAGPVAFGRPGGGRLGASRLGASRLGGERLSSMPRGMETVLVRRRVPARVHVLMRRAAPPAPARLRMRTLSRVLLADQTATRFPATHRPSAPASAAAPVPQAHLVVTSERVALTRTIRVESIGQPGLPGASSPAVPGPRGGAGLRGPAGAPSSGLASSRRPALVLRSGPPPAAVPGHPQHPPTAIVDARPAILPADGPAQVPPPLPSIDEITTQVIRRIERRATAQRERLARPPRG